MAIVRADEWGSEQAQANPELDDARGTSAARTDDDAVDGIVRPSRGGLAALYCVTASGFIVKRGNAI